MMIATIFMLAQAAALAQASQAQSITPDDQQIQQSGSIGIILHALDQAASISTDALLKKMDRAELAGLGGYVVERVPPMGFRVTYFRGKGADARAFYVADVRDGKVVHDELLSAAVLLTARQAELAAARDKAAHAAIANGYKPCTASPFNSVVIPSATGPIAVYLLTAQTTRASYPMGGHFRFVIAPEGKVISHRPFSASCLNLDLSQMPKGGKAVGLVTSNRLDTVPTEIYVFASYALRLPLYVATKDQRLWKVTGRTIELQRSGSTAP
ncbi:hypothetical protein [Sphingobium ummariense]